MHTCTHAHTHTRTHTHTHTHTHTQYYENITRSLDLSISKKFEVGDIITVDEKEGEVVEITTSDVVLEYEDDNRKSKVTIYLPIKQIYESVVTVIKKGDEKKQKAIVAKMDKIKKARNQADEEG